ncbi:sulfate adenylyltransferase, large subunit [Burkholderia pseudomallei]|uniref:sulfate adenylyltransferase subunit 1 n=3 Tax=Burkholderia pseudomallei TaxID=28450 RepID=UPI0003D81A2F|nr:GTP-binding protein [Burkholderia pseudomallei]AHE28698.1 sulfate adenylyltransferase, large subunit [Burkholderia pseudomallei NCTC 13178]AIV59858.1 sulfate adenylyltransferase, large subunit [Burkholderia pseudomallei MSHR2243]AIV72049.1 sulfate adenylyltransferase, large subunit [Burkholderia pseudomallei MSHR62]AIV90685.1 sulfate adenylyltransferase, large subunit [Burkholderia pseudomallei B03]AIV96313.1 sulfate adenylyltransferase, large subunit [Burkholderia pseudomallei A79A]
MSIIENNEDLGVLRFITAGSVDDGKSTLIGRLLYDSKAVLSDQLSALSRAKNKRTVGDELDLALLTDGLEAEREQGITIDVAYRYFATAKRKFIIADTPGHEQYTRNMVTGASTAHAAIILIDATRVTFDAGAAQLLPQTKRHSAIVKLLDLQHVIVAINKMDLVDYSETRFNEIRDAYVKLAQQLGLADVRFVPVSALKGDNIVAASERMPWYAGEPLLNVLETLPVETPAHDALRFPVQWVARQDGSSADDFRGYMGRIEAGEAKVGDEIVVLPSNRTATIAEIIAPVPGGTAAVERAFAGQAVTIRLAEDVDVSRGDTFVPRAQGVEPAKKLEADLCWFDETPLSSQRKYLLKQTTNTVFTKIGAVKQVLDVHTLSHATDRHELKMNDIGRVALTLQKPIVCDTYDAHPGTGAFVLIDEATHHTVAAGMIRAFSA